MTPSSPPAPSDATARTCRLCGAAGLVPLGEKVALRRHVARYALCVRCDLIQVLEPNWLAEAYADAVSPLDTGVLWRNRETVRLTLLVARLLGLGPDDPCLDFGGGHGLFVRSMRDEGLDFRWRDRYGPNLYARGFEAVPGARHRLVTAFEVLEHFEDVAGGLDELFAGDPETVLVSTALHHGWDPGWHYLHPEAGQHIAFFSEKTLAHVAAERGYEVLPALTTSLFLRAGSRLAPRVRRRLGWALADLQARKVERLARKLAKQRPYPSRVQSDHEHMRAVMAPPPGAPGMTPR